MFRFEKKMNNIDVDCCNIVKFNFQVRKLNLYSINSFIYSMIWNRTVISVVKNDIYKNIHTIRIRVDYVFLIMSFNISRVGIDG